MKLVSKIVVAAVITLLIIFALILNSSITFPESISTFMEVMPRQKWILTKGAEGQLASVLIDHKTGYSSNFSITQFDRGESMSFEFLNSMKTKKMLLEGDTIGFVFSSDLALLNTRLEGELEMANAQIASKKSGEKESLVKEAQEKLAHAEIKLAAKKSTFNRTEQLYKKELISVEEYEAVVWSIKQLELERDIYKSQLESITSGVKIEDVKLIESSAKMLKRQLASLNQRQNSFTITTPISGVVNSSFSPDTLLSVLELDTIVLKTPIRTAEIGRFKEGTKVRIVIPILEKKLKVN